MRIASFVFLWMSFAAANAHCAPLSTEKAAAICKTVVALANGGKLADRVIPFRPPTDTERAAFKGSIYIGDVASVDLDHDGNAELVVKVSDGGSCHSESLSTQLAGDDPRAASEYLPFTSLQVAEDDDLRWAGWGQRVHLLTIDGEPIALTGRLRAEETLITLASWFGEGVQRPLCTFVRTGEIRQDVISGDEEVCRVAARGRTNRVPWQAASETIVEALRDRRRTDNGYVARVDLNMDGVADVIGLSVWNSGAGCGTDGISNLYALSPGASSAALQKALDAGPDRDYRSWGPMFNVAKADELLPHLFMYEGRPYLFGPARSGVAVYSFWKNANQKRCDIRQTPQFKIGKSYPVP